MNTKEKDLFDEMYDDLFGEQTETQNNDDSFEIPIDDDSNLGDGTDLTLIEDEGILFSYKYEKDGINYLDNVLISRCGHKIYRERIENGLKRIYLKTRFEAFDDKNRFNEIKEAVDGVKKEGSLLFTYVKLTLPRDPGEWYTDDYLSYIGIKFMSELDKYNFTKIDMDESLKNLFYWTDKDLDYGEKKDDDFLF